MVLDYVPRGFLVKILTIMRWHKANPHIWKQITAYVYTNKLHKKQVNKK